MSYLKKYFNKVEEGKRELSAIAFLAAVDHIEKVSPLVSKKIVAELKDQRSFLKLIASENYSSLAVQLAMGNLLTDKYSEGVPFRRFYAGCGNVDEIEQDAIDRAKRIFKADHAYVQPHSGADANMVAFWAILVKNVQNKEVERLGKKSIDDLSFDEYEKIRQLIINQKIMGMALGSGGHLTHGYRHNISSKMMISHSYDVDPRTGLIDYKDLQEKVMEVKPLILLAGYSAYPRLINFAKMREIADRAGAIFMVDMAHFAGLVAGGVMRDEYDPVAYADVVTSTTHKTLRGPRGGLILCKESFKEVVDKGCPLVLGGPMPHVMAAKAVAFKEAERSEFSHYSHKIVENAMILADTLEELGAKVMTGGTDNHLVLIDVYSSFGLTGRQAESILRKARLTVNRNAIPLDVNGPWYTSGIRLGTPAATTLGMGIDEMKRIAAVICDVLKASKPRTIEKKGVASKVNVDIDKDVLKRAEEEVLELLSGFVLYPELIID